jgi:iron complex outermembrane receptor protein
MQTTRVGAGVLHCRRAERARGPLNLLLRAAVFLGSLSWCAPVTLLAQSVSPSAIYSVSDDEGLLALDRDPTDSDEKGVQAASFLNLQPSMPLVVPVRPPADIRGAVPTTPGSLFSTSPLDPGVLPSVRFDVGENNSIGGAEALARLTSDAGSLLLKSPASISTGIQRRNPIINDPRVRGSRIGSMAASGSYWIPARIDLDTMLSKIDSRIVQQLTVIPGPYNVLNGPGLQTIQFELLPTPRYADGAQLHGATSVDYANNGRQVYGRQDIWGGGDIGGFRFGYGHRTGNDYHSGSGVDIPSSYNSRDINFSFGRDLDPESHIEFSYLRLDQTNVELPGQAFDIDYLSTDAYQLTYLSENQVLYDQLSASAWYNRTRLNGNAQEPGKRRQFPYLDKIFFHGVTDADAMSAGYRVATAWEQDNAGRLTLGTDLRFINQELNEIASGPFITKPPPTANSPIPDSNWCNPGVFLQETWQASDTWYFDSGVRTDLVTTQIVDDPAKLLHVGSQQFPYANVVGTSIQDRSFGLWAAYVGTRYTVADGWNATLQMGHAERAPSLTELYVAQSFMFVLQNGLNTVTGDPRLSAERLWQVDLALTHEGDRFNGQIRGFYSWINDYITFENLKVVVNPMTVEQVQLKYVNTQLATLAGIEYYGTYELTDWITGFANVRYVEGEDQTRNGTFATQQAINGQASRRVYGLPRGSFSHVPGAAKEPLPQIVPLDSRVGLRWHDASSSPWWLIELSARMVGPQNRIATSLEELPSAGFAVGDLRAYLRPSSAWTLQAGVENFTNRNYREHLDFRSRTTIASMFQPGISGYVGAQLTY